MFYHSAAAALALPSFVRPFRLHSPRRLVSPRSVSVHMPKDRVTGGHQGYGFVEMLGEEDAEYALKVRRGCTPLSLAVPFLPPLTALRPLCPPRPRLDSQRNQPLWQADPRQQVVEQQAGARRRRQPLYRQPGMPRTVFEALVAAALLPFLRALCALFGQRAPPLFRRTARWTKSCSTTRSAPLASLCGTQRLSAVRLAPSDGGGAARLPRVAPRRRAHPCRHILSFFPPSADPETGASKGIAFVNFATFEASDAAMAAMEGQYLCNRPISVKYALKKVGASWACPASLPTDCAAASAADVPARPSPPLTTGLDDGAPRHRCRAYAGQGEPHFENRGPAEHAVCG